MAGGRGGSLGSSGPLVRRGKGPREAPEEAGQSFPLPFSLCHFSDGKDRQTGKTNSVIPVGPRAVSQGREQVCFAHTGSRSKHQAASTQAFSPQPQTLRPRNPSSKTQLTPRSQLQAPARSKRKMSRPVGGGGGGEVDGQDTGLRGPLSERTNGPTRKLGTGRLYRIYLLVPVALTKEMPVQPCKWSQQPKPDDSTCLPLFLSTDGLFAQGCVLPHPHNTSMEKPVSLTRSRTVYSAGTFPEQRVGDCHSWHRRMGKSLCVWASVSPLSSSCGGQS